MPTRDPAHPLISVVTVVFNDPQGLARTLRSVQPHLDRGQDQVEHWVVDGSTNGDVRAALARHGDPRVHALHEPDDGLFDAMNKGLRLATGDWVLFVNAGDLLHPAFDPARFTAGSERAGRVIVGYSVETYEGLAFLRPARGREEHGLRFPAHQSTAYPREVTSVLRYDQSLPVSADGRFTSEAVARAGGVFVNELVSVFELGGRSSTYGSAGEVLDRVRRADHASDRAQLVAKAVLWRVLPRPAFYRLLAWRKYERWSPERRLEGQPGRALTAVPPEG